MNPARQILGHRRLDVLDTLHHSGALGVEAIAEDVGTEIAGVRSILAALYGLGYVGKHGRDPTIYTITPTGRARWKHETDMGKVPGVPYGLACQIRDSRP